MNAKRSPLSLKDRGVNSSPEETSQEKKVVAAPTKSVPKRAAAAKKRTPRTKAKTQEKRKDEPATRVVRDSFTMPQDDYALIAEITTACLKMGIPMTKGEVLRAGLQVLSAMTETQLRKAALRVDKIKTGRPKADE